MLEGDALQVVKVLRENLLDRSEGDLFIIDAKSLLNSFAEWSVQHTNKDSNGAAHLLAKNVLHINVDLMLLEDVPDFVKDIVVLDAHLNCMFKTRLHKSPKK